MGLTGTAQAPAVRADVRDLLAIIGLYWLLAHIGLQWATVNGAGSPVWPAAGVGLAGLVLCGTRLWPAILLARLLAAWTSGSEQPLWADVGLAAANAGATAAAAVLLQRMRFDARISTLPDALLLVTASLAQALLAAIAGVTIVTMSSDLAPNARLAVFSNFAFGNFAGALTVAPLLLAWMRLGVTGFARGRLLHLTGCLAVVGALAVLVFAARSGLPLRTWHIFPALVWAAVSFQVRGAAAALLITSTCAVVGSEAGLGPFMALSATAAGRAIFVQQFIGLAGVTILLLAAAVDERRLRDALAAEIAERTAAEARVRAIVDSAFDAIIVVDEAGTIQSFNPAAERIFGRTAAHAIGSNVRLLMPDDATGWKENGGAALMETGIPGGIGTGEFLGHRGDGAVFPLDVSVTEWRDGRGERFFTGIMRDITGRRLAEERERLLTREVDHRAKNMLAVAQSVVHLSRADTVSELKASIVGRIQALARAHGLLAASRWEGADLKQLVLDELAPYSGRDAARAQVTGDAVLLRPAAAQALGLVCHELATNAAKYGALSIAEGWLDVRWSHDVVDNGSARLRIRWTERGGPPVSSPQRRGFGSTVMRASVEDQLQGTVAMHWQPDGLVCELSIPASEIVVQDRPSAAIVSGGGDRTGSVRRLDAVRVLVLEDEALIAMQVAETLTEAGCRVIGPVGRVEDALAVLAVDALDVALLDLNVAGEMSFPVAEALAVRGVPFAFATGYEDPGILPEPLRGRPTIAKPVAAEDLLGVIEALAGQRASGQ